MSEIRTVFDKNSKDLLNLVKGLKNDGFQNKLLQNLLEKHDVNKVNVISEAHGKFKKHPMRITSQSELSTETIKNGFYKDVPCYDPHDFYDSYDVQRENSELMYRFLQHPKPKPPNKPVGFAADNRCFSKTQVAVVSSQAMEVVEKETVINVTVQQEQQQPRKLTHPFNEKVVLDPQPEDNVDKKATEYYLKLHQKLRNIVPKVVHCIEEIRMLLNDKIPEPDGEEDWERRRMRAIEFSTRFARNYLYHLGRQIAEVQKLTKHLDGHVGQMNINTFLCLTNTHHTVLKAMQAYRNHLPAALPHFAVDKLKTILEYVSTLCEMHSKCFIMEHVMSARSENFISELRKKNKHLLVKVQDFIEKTGENPFSVSLLQLNTEAKAPKKPKPKKIPLEARLSMYSISSKDNRKEAFWKQTVQALAKDKFKYNHVQSRYKTAGFKHRPPIEKAAHEPPSKHKVVHKKSSVTPRPSPLASLRNDDDIPTMVGLQKERESKVNTMAVEDKQPSHLTNMELFLRSLQNEYQKHLTAVNNGDMTQEQWDTFVKSLLEMGLLGKINTVSRKSGSKKNGWYNAKEINFAEMAQAVVQCVCPTLANEGRNGLASSHHTKSSLDTKHTSSSTHTVVEKPRQNGETDTIVSPRSDVTLTEEISKPNDSYDIVEIFKSSRTKSKQRKKAEKQKNKRRQTVTVTGAKNAQLICICDEDSVVESVDESKPTLTNSKEQQPNVCNKSSSLHQRTSNPNQETMQPNVGNTSSSINQKSSNPNQHTSNPNQHTSNPNQHTSNPNQHTSNPNQQTLNPNQETMQPNVCNKSSSINQKSSNPNQHTSKPNQHTSNPNQHTSKPNQHTSNPNQHTSNPNQHTSKPNQHTSNPNQHTSKPNQQTSNPNQQAMQPNVYNKSSSLNQHTSNPNQQTSNPKQTNSRSVALRPANPRMSKGCIKISRLPRKSLKPLMLMPQEQVTKIVKYKFQYGKFVKANYLYQKSSRIKPWNLVEKLSEHLLDDLLLSIADDIQISKVVESLIRSEFQ